MLQLCSSTTTEIPFSTQRRFCSVAYRYKLQEKLSSYPAVAGLQRKYYLVLDITAIFITLKV